MLIISNGTKLKDPNLVDLSLTLLTTKTIFLKGWTKTLGGELQMGGQKFKRSKIEEGENYIIKGSKGINPVIGKKAEKKQILHI